MIKDDIAELIANCAGDAEITGRHYFFAVAILDLPHPVLTCTVKEALERDAEWLSKPGYFPAQWLPDGRQIKVKE